jgi:hypothetical protein
MIHREKVREQLIENYDPNITNFLKRRQQNFFESPFRYFSKTELCNNAYVGSCKTLTVSDSGGGEPPIVNADADISLQNAQNKENEPDTDEIFVNETLSCLEWAENESDDEGAWAEHQRLIQTELEILQDRQKMIDKINRDARNKGVKEKVVNVENQPTLPNYMPTFKSPSVIVDEITSAHFIVLFVLHFHALLFTGLCVGFGFPYVASSIILVNFIYILCLCIESFNDLTLGTLLCSLKEGIFYALESSAEYVLSKVSNKVTVKQISNFDATKDLSTEDRMFTQRGTVLNLSKQNRAPKEYKNFMVLINFFNLPNVLGEIDSDSQLSLISEDYFNNYLKPKLRPSNILDEPPMTFKGLGSSLRSRYPPPYFWNSKLAVA